MPDASYDDPRGIVLLCMSFAAAIALAVESVWIWVPWLLVAATAVAGAYFTLAAARERAEAEERRDACTGAD